MEELLYKSDEPWFPIGEQEFYRLVLDELAFSLERGFLVKQSHAVWNEARQNIRWDGIEAEVFESLEDAERRYQERRTALKALGFLYSDMDPIL